MSRDFSAYTPLESGEPTIALFELWDMEGRTPYLQEVTSDPTTLSLTPGTRLLKREYVPASTPVLVNEAA